MFAVPDDSGRFFFSDDQGRISASDRTGKVLWSTKTDNGPNTNSAPVVSGTLAAYAGDRTLAALSSDSGSVRWTVNLDTASSGIFGRRPVVAGKRVFISTNSGLASYDVDTGNESGVVAFPNGSDMTPSFTGGSLFVVSKTGVFYVIDSVSLSIKSSISTNAVQPVAGAPIIRNDRAWFADRKGMVFAVSLSSNSVLWHAKLDAAKSVEVFSDPTVTETGIYIVARGVLYGLSASSGKPLFAPVSSVTTPVCYANGLLWCGGAEKTVFAIDPREGKIVRKVFAPASVSGKPACSGDLVSFPLVDGQELILNIKDIK